MNRNVLSVREIRETDITPIADYWLNSDKAFLKGMGVDLDKLPSREEWGQMLMEQLNTPLEQKKSYCIIWVVDGKATGHSNINKIIFGEEAFMHLHIWDGEIRAKGFGLEWIRMTLPYFFENYNLKKLYCEPYALNPAPNRILEKAGFELVKEYVTTPGWINFEQPVKLWEMTLEKFRKTNPL